MTGDVERLLTIAPPPLIAGADDGIRVIGLGLAGRREESRQGVMGMKAQAPRIAVFEAWTDYLLAWLDRRVPEMVAHMASLAGLKIMDDPEAMFQEGWLLLRDDPAFVELLAEAEAGRQRALDAFRESGGERLLGR
jgi:hypothetical protein